jgi:hypothetical protein
MIMGEFHMIPLKINNYNHMKTTKETALIKTSFFLFLFLLISNFIFAQEPVVQDTVVQQTTVQDSTIKKTPKKKTKKKKDSFKVFAGATYSSLKTATDKYDSNPQIGYLLGFSYKSGRFFYYEIGATYNNSSYQVIDKQNGRASSTDTTTFSVGAIDFPIKLGLNFTSFADRLIGVRVFAGVIPAFTLNVGDNDMGYTKDNINKFNFYGEGGVGIDVAFIFVEAGINYGFSDLLSNNIQSNPQQFFVNLGFRF